MPSPSADPTPVPEPAAAPGHRSDADAQPVTDDRIEVRRTIPAPPEAIFAVLRDPQGHVAIDASGMLQAAEGAPVSAAGDEFVVHMDREALGDRPLGRYDVTVVITSFVPDREISWTVAGRVRPPLGHRYGYLLEPVPEGTVVTSFVDWSAADPSWRAQGVFPVVGAPALRATLGILERVVARRRGGPFDLVEVDRLLSTTRSVRRRLDPTRPVDPQVVLECLRLAVQAPTASNSQNWRWLVVTDPDTRAALAELYRSAGADYLRRQAEREPSGQTGRVLASARYLADHLHEMPVHVIPCVAGRPPGSSTVAQASFYGSILPATWSFMLALRARGLGSAWTTLHLVRERDAAELLGLPEDVTQVALLPVAATVGTDFRPAVRPPVETITWWDRWGTPGPPATRS
jgi:nitroreductase/uncharacterized protein YndB with AHSA1/START domain